MKQCLSIHVKRVGIELASFQESFDFRRSCFGKRSAICNCLESLIFSLKLKRNFDCTQLKVVHEHGVRRNESVAWDLIDAKAESRRDNYTATLARAHTSNSALDALGEV